MIGAEGGRRLSDAARDPCTALVDVAAELSRISVA